MTLRSKKHKDREGSRETTGSIQKTPATPIPRPAWQLVIIRTIEWALLGLFCAILLYLHILLYQYSGSFWRDEASCIQIADSPSLASMWASLPMDSSPALYTGFLRLWIFTGPGATDSGIRLFGTLMALGIVIAVLLSFRMLNRSVPLLAVALVGMNVIIFYFGSSIRPYGLAAVLIVLCFTSMWKVVQAPTRWNITAAFILAMLAVHCSYQNCYLLFGIGVAGAVACIVCRLWMRCLLVLTICLITAISLLVYLPTLQRYHDMWMILAQGADLGAILAAMVEAFVVKNINLCVVWGAALLSALVFLPYQYYLERRRQPGGQTPSLYLYSLITIVTGGTAGILFLRASNIFPYAWHFIPLLALMAVTVEIGANVPRPALWLSALKAAATCAIVGVSVMPLWRSAHVRRTNLDLLCNVLAEKARPSDLILVSPFWLSPGFNYLYHGKTPWTTIPAVPSDRNFRLAPHAHIKELMATPGAIRPTLDKIEDTLRAGNRVWFVGEIEFPQSDAVPPELPPAPHPEFQWNSNPYMHVWSMQVGRFLQDHATGGIQYAIPIGQPIYELEDIKLFYAEGWQ
jgi:hypothetical protein